MISIFSKYQNKNKYSSKLLTFILKGYLDDRDKKELDDLALSFSLSKNDLKPIHQKAFSLLFNQIITDQRITSQEKTNMENVLNYFDLSQGDYFFDQQKFNKYYSLAQIDDGVLPEPEHIGLDIIFKKDEILHWLCPATLAKYKNVVDRVSYAGFRSSLRICKGLSYRTGSYKIGSESKEHLLPQDTGTFWITNQRLGFRGARKNIIIDFKKVNMFDLTEVGLIISKDGRETPYLLILDDYDVPLSILSIIVNKNS